MVSIITPIFNQLSMNKLFYESLVENTHNPFELIIIDNNSNDGSGEFFKGKSNVVYIKNDSNYSYPHSNNQGLAVAQYDYIALLNNDILLSKDWDKKLMETMDNNGLQFISPCGNERMENKDVTKSRMRKWKTVSNPLRLISLSITSLRLMVKLMYGNFQRFALKRYLDFKLQTKEGFCGFLILTKKEWLSKLDGMDSRIQSADWDLFIKSKKRSIEVGDVKPMHIALDVFVHHFGRLTYKQQYPPFTDKNNLIEFNEKWDKAQQNQLLQNV